MIEVRGTVTVIVTTTVPKRPESIQAFLNILQSRNAHSQDALEVSKYHTVTSFSCNPDYKLCMWVATLSKHNIPLHSKHNIPLHSKCSQ